MTRGQGPDTTLSFRVFGAADARRTILVLREGAAATVDPAAAVTATRLVRIIAVRLAPVEISDPGAFGGETHAEVTVGSLAELVDEEVPHGAQVGVAGVGEAWDTAVLLAGEARVDRLALVAAPRPGTALMRDEAARALARVQAKTLILSGQKDPASSAADAAWMKEHVGNARVEMVPAASTTGIGGALTLADVWPRVLSHLAPGTARQPSRGQALPPRGLRPVD